MKGLFIVFFSLSFLFSSCYTKNQSIRKFCTSTMQDTTVYVHDTVIVQAIKADTFFSYKIDTFTLVKNKLTIKYKRVIDSIYLSGECHADTIYSVKEVRVKMPCKEPVFSKNEAIKKLSFYFLFTLIIGFTLGLLAKR